MDSHSNKRGDKNVTDREIELLRLKLDERIAEREHQIQLKGIELKEAEHHRSRWSHPIVLSIIAAAIAAAGNGYISWLNGSNQIDIEATKHASLKAIEQEKAEAARILEAMKGVSPEDSAEKIRFLIDVGLISDLNRQAALEHYLKPKKEKISSTSEVGAIIVRYRSGWLRGGNNKAAQCQIGRAAISQSYPGKSVLLKSSSEQSKKDIFGRVEYQYFCEFEIK